MFLIDTDHLVILQRQTGALCDALMRRIDAYQPSEFYISIVSFHEQLAGWQAFLGRKRESQHVVRAYAEFEPLLAAFASAQIAPFDATAADRFDSLRAGRVRIGSMDLRIAATALARDFTVLTRNTVDFAQVPNLRVEDWTVILPEKPK